MLITTGPPKCGTTALKKLSQRLGFTLLPGAVIYGEWKRHEDWVESGKRLPKDLIKEHIIRSDPEDAYAALTEGHSLHGHIPPPTPHHIPTIVILRDPRAAMVSWWRAKQLSKRGLVRRTPDRDARRVFSAWLLRGGVRAMSYIKPIHQGWTEEEPRDTLLIVHYETLFTHETMQLIADFVSREAVDPLTIYGKGSKFSGMPTEVDLWYDDRAQERFDRLWEMDNLQSLSSKSSNKAQYSHERTPEDSLRVREPETGQEPTGGSDTDDEAMV